MCIPQATPGYALGVGMSWGPFPTALWRLRSFHVLERHEPCHHVFQSEMEAIPHQWASVSENNSECVPTSSRDGASKRNQHDPNDRLRDACKFIFKAFHSLFSSERAAEVSDAYNQLS